MLIHKAFRFELKPNNDQIHKMNQFCGCARFVFNRALAYQKDNSCQAKLNYNELTKLLLEWKREFTWLKDCYSQVLQQSLKDLENAFKNFFAKRANFPKFKRKGEKESFRFPQNWELEQHNNRIRLPKIGWINYRNSRQVVGRIKNVTVSKKCGKWYVSIQTEIEQDLPQPSGGEAALGIDMGITRFATLSNGQFFEPINAFKTLKGKLSKLQKQFKNKTKFSKNWMKLQAKISKLHNKIANIRKNYLHQISNYISKNHAIVYVEDLQVKNMSKRAIGKNVTVKSGLNRAILDQDEVWYEFRRQLDYKLFWSGGHLIAVNPKNTSRCCPACGHTAKANRKSQAHFECVKCGYTNNADLVGAINILKRGHKILSHEKANPSLKDKRLL